MMIHTHTYSHLHNKHNTRDWQEMFNGNKDTDEPVATRATNPQRSHEWLCPYFIRTIQITYLDSLSTTVCAVLPFQNVRFLSLLVHIQVSGKWSYGISFCFLTLVPLQTRKKPNLFQFSYFFSKYQMKSLIKISNSCFRKEQYTIMLIVQQQKLHNYFEYITECGTASSKNKWRIL